MKILTLSLLMLLTAICPGCSTSKDTMASREQIFYYDRNGDGKVDLEKHHYPGVADADWELRDDDYDGRYERKVVFGIGIFYSKVDLPVPTHVHIEANP